MKATFPHIIFMQDCFPVIHTFSTRACSSFNSLLDGLAPSNTLHDHRTWHILVLRSSHLRAATMLPLRTGRVLFTSR